MKKKIVQVILDYVLDWRFNDDLHVFRRRFQLCVVVKPLRKFLAFVGVAGETFRFYIPFVAHGAGNFRIVAHSNHGYVG
jgi:hypothetical protein